MNSLPTPNSCKVVSNALQTSSGNLSQFDHEKTNTSESNTETNMHLNGDKLTDKGSLKMQSNDHDDIISIHLAKENSIPIIDCENIVITDHVKLCQIDNNETLRDDEKSSKIYSDTNIDNTDHIKSSKVDINKVANDHKNLHKIDDNKTIMSDKPIETAGNKICITYDNLSKSSDVKTTEGDFDIVNSTKEYTAEKNDNHVKSSEQETIECATSEEVDTGTSNNR